MRTYNAKSKKRSAKSSTLEDDDSALALYELLLFEFLFIAVHVILSLLVSFSLLFCLIHFLAFHPALGIPLNIKRKQRSQNEAEQEIIT